MLKFNKIRIYYNLFLYICNINNIKKNIMDTIKISEWFDGYCLTHNGVDYKYQGKSESVIKMMTEKVQLLLNKDLEELKKSLLNQHHLS